MQGWQLYDAKREFARQGVGSRTRAWRMCDINAGYGVSRLRILLRHSSAQ